MSKQTLAILFFFGTMGALRQAIKFWTSPVYDVLGNRILFAMIASIITLVLLFFTIKFWKQSEKKNKYL